MVAKTKIYEAGKTFSTDLVHSKQQINVRYHYYYPGHNKLLIPFSPSGALIEPSMTSQAFCSCWSWHQFLVFSVKSSVANWLWQKLAKCSPNPSPILGHTARLNFPIYLAVRCGQMPLCWSWIVLKWYAHFPFVFSSCSSWMQRVQQTFEALGNSEATRR
jgi:hypothetical protein